MSDGQSHNASIQKTRVVSKRKSGSSPQHSFRKGRRESQAASNASTSTMATQTDLELLVTIACEMLLNELHLAGTDDAIMRKVRQMVDRILAKCRQSGCLLKGLVGVNLSQSPMKESQNFVDMHAQANDPSAKKSYHFHINEMKTTDTRNVSSPHSQRTAPNPRTLNKDMPPSATNMNLQDVAARHLQTVHNKY